MKLKQLALPLVLVIMAFLSSCKPENSETAEPSLQIPNQQIEIPAIGGTFTIEYTLTNPTSGATLEAISSEEWLLINSISDGIIRYDVAENVSEQRNCTINVSYPGVETISISVTQLAKNEEPTDASFEISFSEVSEVSFNFSVIPSDKEMYYIYFLENAAYLADNGFESDEDIIAADLAYFQSESETYGMTLEENVMNYYATSGDIIDNNFAGAIPGNEYVVYAYGFEFVDGEMIILTSLSKEFVTTLVVEPEDAFIELDVQLDGSDATITYNPGDFDGHYFVFNEEISYIFERDDVTDEELSDFMFELWYEYMSLYLSFGFSLDMLYGEMALQGAQTVEYSLFANAEYFVGALPLDENGVAFANPTVVRFETATVEASDNVLDITVSNVKSRTAYMKVVPSNDDPYVFACFSEGYVEGMTDQEIVDMLNEYYAAALMPTVGEVELDITGLIPETDYMVIAFGYEGGIATTELFKEYFTTQADEVADIEVTANIYGVYDMDELLALDSSLAGSYPDYDARVITTYETNPEVPYLYCALYSAASLEGVDDEAILEQLLTRGKREVFDMINYCTYNKEYIIVMAAEDAEGRISPLYKHGPFTLTYEMRSDPQEFIDYLRGRSSFTFSVPAEFVSLENAISVISDSTPKQSVQTVMGEQAERFKRVERVSNRQYYKR